jgi:hypothetical protein
MGRHSLPERDRLAVRFPLALLTALCACVSFTGTQAAGQPDRALRLVYTAETHGNLLPCACPGHPLGGLARRIGFIDSLRAAGEPILLVDAGRFFPERTDYPLLPETGLSTLLDLHADAAVAAGYDAIALPEERGSTLEGAPWLRSNEARLLTKGGLRLALVAVDERGDASGAAGAVRSLGTVDLVILLCSGDLNFAFAAAKSVGAQVAVVSRGACLRGPLRQDGVLFLGPGQAGKFVGFAELEVGARKQVRPIRLLLRPMDASVPADSLWRERVEQTTLAIERAHPLALSQGE